MNSNPKGQNVVVCPVCGLVLPAQLKKCPQDGVVLDGQAPNDPLVGTIVGGRYEVLSLIGLGGVSQIYRARNRAVGSIVAVKTLKQDLISDDELFQRFCQEAKAVQMLVHPHIISVEAFGVTLSGQPFIVMDYLDGKTLADEIEQLGRIPVARTLKIFSQVCDALAHAHAHKILHRDIKPGNIMLLDTPTDTDVVRIFDFGFAKLLPRRGIEVQMLTQMGDILGTPLYMSPEQTRAQPLDSRSDIYSLGCVMYEALTGRAPLVGQNVLETMQKHCNELPVPLDLARPDIYIPDKLTQVLFKTLEKNPDKRYQSMLDLKRDLELLSSGVSGKAAMLPGSLPGLDKLKELPPERELPPLTSVLALTVGALLVALAISMILMFIMHPPAPEAPKTASKPSAAKPIPVGDPKINWVRFRQAGLKALKRSDYTEAEEMLEYAQGEAAKTDDADANSATVLIDLSRVYTAADRLSDAEKAANNAFALRNKLHQGNSRAMSEVFVCFGEICLARQDYPGADSYLQKALAIQQRELGPMHQDLAVTLNDLGKAAEGQHSYARAEAYYKQALAIRQSALGPGKQEVADVLTNYAQLLKHMGRSAEAAKIEQRVRTITPAHGK